MFITFPRLIVHLYLCFQQSATPSGFACKWKRNTLGVEATKAPTCELMRGPMLSSEAPASTAAAALLLGERTEHTPGCRSRTCCMCVCVCILKRRFPQDARAPRSIRRTYASHAHVCTHTNGSGGFGGTKDHEKTKAQMTPSCDNPTVAVCHCLIMYQML